MKFVVLTLLLIFIGEFSMGSYVPKRTPGEVFMYAGSSCPQGSISADGSSLARTGTYVNLYKALSTTYGHADGSHFNVPNAKGVFIRGAGSQTIGGTSYSGTQGTSQNDEFASHTHSVYGFSSGGVNSTPGNGASAGLGGWTSASGGGYVQDAPTGGNQYISSAGTGTETFPANIVLLYCIVY